MTHYTKEGNCVFIASSSATTDFLEPKTYVVKLSQTRGFFLETVDDFEMPKKIYGDIDTRANRILGTFHDRPAQTGALLIGEKGSGKTLLAKRIALLAQETGLPVILINSPFYGDPFNTFMSSIDTPAVVIFDEFEKVYDKDEHQPHLLTLLDGVFNSKKLFLLTCNDEYRLNSHITNRPSRVFYRFEYKGLEEDFITEYCKDCLKDQSKTAQILNLKFTMGEKLNFDILKSLVEEMNRYSETVTQAISVLNVTPANETSMFTIRTTLNGEPVLRQNQKELWINPFGTDENRVDIYFLGKKLGERSHMTTIYDPISAAKAGISVEEDFLEYEAYGEDDDEDGDEDAVQTNDAPQRKVIRVWCHPILFSGEHLVGINRKIGTFTYQIKFEDQVVEVELMRVASRHRNTWDSLL
jgi:hypothetical protein